jgi:hypothetical protein
MVRLIQILTDKGNYYKAYAKCSKRGSITKTENEKLNRVLKDQGDRWNHINYIDCDVKGQFIQLK